MLIRTCLYAMEALEASLKKRIPIEMEMINIQQLYQFVGFGLVFVLLLKMVKVRVRISGVGLEGYD